MRWQRILILLFLLAVLISVYTLDVDQHLNLSFFLQKRALLYHWAEVHPYLLALGFLGTYLISICLFLPLSSLLCVLAGIFFPLPLAITLGVVSETFGALLFFFLLSFLLEESKIRKTLITWKRTKEKFQENMIYYLLFFRLSHLIPYWLINTVASSLKVPIGTFIWTTAIGVLPFVVIMTEGGNSIKHDFMQGHHIKITSLFTTTVQLSFLALGILALLPILIKKWIHRKRD